MRNKTPITIVLLGDIAAGKGTQGSLLAKRYHLQVFDVGEYSRKVYQSKSAIGKRFARVKSGKLAPSDAIQKYLQKSISSLNPEQGVLIDGGKMPAEAKLIYRLLREQKRRVMVIYITIPEREIRHRLALRIQKQGRHDDSPAAVKNRIAYYKKIYSKTIKFWQELGLLKKISGRGSIQEVNQRIRKLVKNYFSIN